MGKLAVAKSSLDNLRDRLSNKQDESENKVKRDALTDAFVSKVNAALGDRVAGQISKFFDSVQEKQVRLDALHDKSIRELSKMLLQSHTDLTKSLNNIRGDGKVIPGMIKGIPNHADAIQAIAESLKELPRTFPEQKEIDLTEISDLLFKLLEVTSTKPKDLGPDLRKLQKQMNIKREFVFTVVRDSDTDLIQRVVVSQKK